MAYTVTDLITRAWYLSGKIARDEETLSGSDLKVGLDLLNAVLAIKSSTVSRIPYFQKYTFNFDPLQANPADYIIPGLVNVETVTFYIGEVRYMLQYQGRTEFYGSPRVNSISSLPTAYHTERDLGGMLVSFFPTPNDSYLCEIWGKFSLSFVSPNQDLLLSLDPYYIEYLRYALASQMADEFNITFMPQNVEKLKIYERAINNIAPLDLTVRKLSTLQGRSSGPDQYLDANIANGWRP